MPISFELTIRNPKKMTEYFVISESPNGVWIGREDGEGMELKSEMFYKAFKKLYDENF